MSSAEENNPGPAAPWSRIKVLFINIGHT